MKRILTLEVEEGGTLDCKECPFAVKRLDETCGEYEYICNVEKNPFNCSKYDLTTLKIIGE